MKKNIIYTLVLVSLLAAGCNEKLFGTPRDGTSTRIYEESKQKLDRASEQTKQRTEENLISVYQTVEGSSLNKPGGYQTEAGKVALDLLKSTHRVETKDYGSLGEMVIGIDGATARLDQFWAFYVNGQLANEGAGSYVLKNSDKVEWKLNSVNSYQTDSK